MVAWFCLARIPYQPTYHFTRNACPLCRTVPRRKAKHSTTQCNAIQYNTPYRLFLKFMAFPCLSQNQILRYGGGGGRQSNATNPNGLVIRFPSLLSAVSRGQSIDAMDTDSFVARRHCSALDFLVFPHRKTRRKRRQRQRERNEQRRIKAEHKQSCFPLLRSTILWRKKERHHR